MNHSRSRFDRVAAGGLAALAACHAPPVSPPPATEAAQADVAVASAPPAPETIWGYLEHKYDGDGDGRVTREEYTRDAVAFDRLDRDGDGSIRAADFVGGIGVDPASVRATIARMMIRRLFEMDGDESQLHVGELEEGIGLLDANFDGGIDGDELEAMARAKVEPGDPVFGIMKGQLGDASPFETLVQVLDQDDDRRIVRDEWFAYFFEHADVDDEYVWTLEDGEGDADDGAAAAGDFGAAEGELAPDFELASPDGEQRWHLASFRGEKPVALVFGSYT